MSTETPATAAVAQQVARAELMKRVLIVITTILVTAVLFLILVVLSAVRDTLTAVRSTQETGSPVLKAIQDQQDDIEDAAESAVSTNELLLGCFDPKSQCAKQTAVREAERAGAYNAAVIATQFCADQVLPDVYTHRQLTLCVGKILEGEGHQ